MALENIAKGMGIEKACHQAGIGISTFYRLKNKEEWRELYEKARMQGLTASGMEIEKAQRMLEFEKEGFRIEKPHSFPQPERSFPPAFLFEEGWKRISNELEQVFLSLEKAFDIVEKGKEPVFFDVVGKSADMQKLYDLLWEIQHSMNRIKRFFEILSNQISTQTVSSNSNQNNLKEM